MKALRFESFLEPAVAWGLFSQAGLIGPAWAPEDSQHRSLVISERSLAWCPPFSMSSCEVQRSGVFTWNVAVPGSTARRAPSPLVCMVCFVVLAVPRLSDISLAFQVEPGVQPLGPASEGHENFPPKNAVTDQESSQQIQQLVSCTPGFG